MALTVPLKPKVNVTKPMGGNEQGRKPLLMVRNPVFEGENGSYEILADQCIGSGGESQVFLARKQGSSELVVAKIYDQFQNTRTNRENRNRVIEFVQSHSDYRNTHIMPILDCGWVTVEEVDESYKFPYPIDILPYCKGGEIKKASFQELRQSIIPQIVSAIHLMHTEGLAHRDIKPGNIYRYKDTVVIADFGTSCSIGPHEMFGTQTRRGTLGYTPPEVWQGYVVTASDYYSLGCTIATIYKGEHVYQHLVDLNDEGALNRAINASGLPLNCPPDEESLQVLVDALTVMRDTDRVGYEGVQLWLTNPKEFEQRYKHQRSSTGEKPFEIKYNGVMCYSEQELAALMNRNWEYSKRDLYSRYSMLPQFYSVYDATKGRAIGDVVEARETAKNQDLGLAEVLHLIYPEGPLYWRYRTYRNAAEISEALAAKQNSDDNITSMLTSGYISWKLENSSGSNTAEIRRVKEIERIAKKYNQLGCKYAQYQFSAEKEKQTFHGLKTPDEIFEYITERPKEFNQGNSLTNDDELLAYLAFLGYGENVEKYKDSIVGKTNPEIAESAYRLFEAICKNKTSVRDYYMKYSPRGYLYWIKQNLALYSFNSEEAESVRAKMAGEPMDSSMTVTDLSSHFTRLNENKNDFMRMFHNNVLLAFMGIGNDKESNGITSTNSDAYFLEKYCGVEVPVGYMRFLDMKK